MTINPERDRRRALRDVRGVVILGFISVPFILIISGGEIYAADGKPEGWILLFIVGILGSLVCFIVGLCQLIARAARRDLSVRRRHPKTLRRTGMIFSGIHLGVTCLLTVIGSLYFSGVLFALFGIVTTYSMWSALSLNIDPMEPQNRRMAYLRGDL